MTMSRLRNQCVVFEREGVRDGARKESKRRWRVLQLIVEGLSLGMVQSSNQQQRSSSVVSHEDDEGVVGVEELGLFYVLLL